MAFTLDYQPKESLPQQALRTGARAVARGAESVAGLPGDIANLVLGLTNVGIRGVTGKESPLPSSLPIGSEALRGVTKSLTGQYLEPQTPGERTFDELVSDLATVAVPFKGKLPFAKTAARVVAGHGVKEFAKSLGAGEELQTGLKLGTQLLSGTKGTLNFLRDVRKKAYTTAEQLSAGKKIDASSLLNSINSIKKSASKGDVTSDAKEFALKKLGVIKDKITRKNIPVEEVWELKKDFNKLISSGDYPEGALPYIERIVGGLNTSLSEFGQKSPEFAKNFLVAEDIHRGLAQKSQLNKFLQDNVSVSRLIKNPLVQSLFGIGVAGGSLLKGVGQALKGTAAAAGTLGTLGIGAREAVKTFEFIKNSPIARKAYGNVLKEVVKNDAAAVARNITKLNKVADKYQQDHKEKFILTKY